MDIMVEIGTDHQKDKIHFEIRDIIGGFLTANKRQEAVNKVVVPHDFDSAIRSILSDDTYKSDRLSVNHKAMAKTCFDRDAATIVFSPLLFTAAFDTQVRSLLYIHEACHALIHPSLFSTMPDLLTKKLRLQSLLFSAWEEYYANRKTLDVVNLIFDTKSLLMQQYLESCRSGHMENLQNDALHYDKLRETISDFKHGLIQFNDAYPRILSLIGTFSLDMVFYFSYCHAEPASTDESDAAVDNIELYNIQAEALIDFLKRKYEDENLTLKLGLPLVDSYLAIFGTRFEDTEQGLYCHIDFI